ncbi:MAG TPA: hypothetical protein P5221_09735, partial [Bacteroidia bacterium]|nr:hypothetical protein [Bacteroidia bacterium]
MDVRIEESWKQRLKAEFEKEYFLRLVDFVKEEYRTRTIYPPGSRLCNIVSVKLKKPRLKKI